MIPGFEIEQRIGRGGFAEIIAARRRHDGRAAAIKLAHARSSRGRIHLAREAEVLRAVGTALAPDILGEGELEDGTRWLALERLRVPSLGARLAGHAGPLPFDEFRAAALALASALARLHAAGWCHLDLKPGHVFVEGAAARLVDFGLASRPSGASMPAPPGASVGTAAYMSPEQVRGDPPDTRADVYAAGVILFELATGAPPFDGAPGEVRQAHLALRPPRPTERAPVSPELEAVILRCLAKDPEERYRDGEALRAALASSLDKEPGARAAPGRMADLRLQRRTVAVVHLESDADLLTLTRAFGAMGAVLARSAGRQHAFVFEPGARENAVRLGLDGARAALDAGLAARALVDLSTVPVIDTPGGPRYLLPSAAAGPAPSAPPGIMLTPSAAATVPDVSASPAPEDAGLLRVATGADAASRSAPLIGRDPTLAELVRTAKEALASRSPAIASVTGDAGLGKTRLGAALAERLRALPSPPQVLELRARDGVLGGDETLRALLGWALGVRPNETPLDQGRSTLAALLPAGPAQDGWAPLALALGWISGEDPALRPWHAAPGALRAAAVRGAGQALRARAADHPLCIIIDDAHLADAAALDALEYAALAEAAVPLFVCALARPALHAARPGLGERAGRSASLHLFPLPPGDAAELCRRLLLPAENVPARAIERLVERTRGIPILLVELVRGLRANGLVRQRGDEGRWFVATDELEHLPGLPLVDWLAQREMAGLPEALAAHARLIALLADEVGRAEVRGVVTELDRDGAAVATTLDPDVATRRLLEIRVLSEKGERVSFRHPLLREAVARSASEQEQRAVHRAAFRFYLLAAQLTERERLQRLALHAEACGLRGEAASLWLRIAESLRARHAYLEAEIHFTRALAQLAADDARGCFAALRGRGSVRYRLGRYEDAIGDLAAAEARARALDDRQGQVTCLLDEATALDWMNDYARSAERVATAQRLVSSGASSLDAARLELARARTLFRAARFAEAVTAFEAAAALAEPLGDEGYETLVVALLMLGPLLPNLGRAEDARTALDRAMSLANSHGDALHLASALNNRRNLWVLRGELEPAVEDQRSFLRIGRDLGMIGIEYVGQFNLGELLYQAGNLPEAEIHVTRAVDLERRHPEVASRPVARLLQARLRAYRGDLEGAREWLDEVRQCEARSRLASELGLLAPSDRVLAEAIDLTVERAGPARWAELCARSTAVSLEQEPIEVHELHGLAALRAGRAAEARTALAEALALTERLPNLMRARVSASLALVEAAG